MSGMTRSIMSSLIKKNSNEKESINIFDPKTEIEEFNRCEELNEKTKNKTIKRKTI